MIRLGGHGLPVRSDDPYAFARAHKAFGYGAAYCPPVRMDNPQRIADIRKAFEMEGIPIAEVGIWRNLVASDEVTRKANRAYAAELLAIADEVGAKCAVTYIGTYLPDSDYAPDPRNFTGAAFDDCVSAARELIDTVKPKRTKLALEMMQYSLPDSVDNYRELIRAIDRPAFAAHVDPVNLVLTLRQYWNTGAIIRECFEKLGRWIVSCHAKDIVLNEYKIGVHLDEIIPGRGVLDYATYLSELDRLHDVPLMLEHLSDGDYAVARDHIFAVGDEIGVRFTARSL